MIAPHACFRELLRELRRSSPSKTALPRLEGLLELTPADDETAVEIHRVLVERHMRVPPALARRWTPGVGEAYVLLVGTVRAHVGRLRVERRSGSPSETISAPELDDRARVQLDVVHEALVRLRAANGVGVPSDALRLSAWTVEDGPVTGDSLGVSSAAALVSLWSGVAPSATVAATAAVNRDGTLAIVERVEEKLGALSRAYPGVRRVIVASSQDTPANTFGFELLRRATLDAALLDLGLSIESFPAPLLATDLARREIEQLRFEYAARYSRAEWQRLATKASTLSIHPRLGDVMQARARAFAALFFLHAGLEDDAARLVRDLDQGTLGDADEIDQVRFGIVRATAAIDADGFDTAVHVAAATVEKARVMRGQGQNDVLGRALGTLGRAHVHAGDAYAALGPLREAVEHHRRHEPATLARTLNYLATAERRAGLLDQAVATVEEALSVVEANPAEQESSASRLFALYERGRIRYARGELLAAMEDFECIRAAQPDPWSYPRLGCHRYLAVIALRIDQPIARELLTGAMDQAETTSAPRVLRRIAAASCGEALLWPQLPPDLRARAETIWRAGGGVPGERARLDSLVY